MKYAPNVTTIYEGAFEYLNGTLQRIGLEEGQLIRNSNATYTVHYYLKDHLSNVRQVINEAGTVLQETEYYAFGMPVIKNGASNNKYLYNGKELQPNTGWLDYGARMYMPEIGRWGGIDPMAEKYFGVTGYNYVLNNPFLIIDPNGADTMLVHAETGKPIDKLMRKGGEDVIFISGENGTWENAFQLYYQLNITGKNGGTASKQNTPVHWRWKDSEGKYKYLSDQTIRFDAVTQNWVAYFEKENTRFNEFYGAGNQLMRLDFFREKVTDNAPLDIKALSNPTSFHPGVIGEWSWYNGQLMRYDDYENISYGMVGAAFGLKNWLLLVGAHVNQIGKNIKGLFGSDGTSGVVDDSRDSRMINKGINLYYHQK